MRFKHKLVGPKTQEEWAEAYEERAGEPFSSRKDDIVFWDEYKGIMVFRYVPQIKRLQMGCVVGDGKFWKKCLWDAYYKFRDAHGCVGIETCTERNPVAYQRLNGGTLVRKVTEEYMDGSPSRVWWYFHINPEDAKG